MLERGCGNLELTLLKNDARFVYPQYHTVILTLTGLGYAATRSGFRAKFGVQGVLGTTMDMFAMEELPGGGAGEARLEESSKAALRKISAA